MPIFPLTQFDFPNVTHYDSDLREVLRLYEIVKNAYTGLLERYDEIKSEYDAIIARLDRFDRELAQMVRAEVARAILPVEARIAVVEARIDRLNDLITSSIENVTEGYQSADEVLRMLIDATDELIRADFGQALVSLENKLDASVADLQAQIDALEFKLPDIYNLVRGYETPIAEVIYDVYDAARDHANTALEYDDKGLTASQFDAQALEALTLDTQANVIYYPRGVCSNPFTGEKESVCDVIAYVAQVAMGDNNITAGGFDALEITAEEYDGKLITAVDFDFRSKTILTP